MFFSILSAFLENLLKIILAVSKLFVSLHRLPLKWLVAERPRPKPESPLKSAAEAGRELLSWDK